MIKILHLINGADLGGISSMILNYYTHMNKEKFHFDFVSPLKEEGVNGKKLQDLECKFYYIPKKSDGLLHYIRKLDQLMKKEHYDAIHVHSNLTSYIGLMVAWKNGIRVRVAHGHNADFRNNKLKQKIYQIVGHVLISLFATDRLACSEDSLVYTFGDKAKKSKNTMVLPNAIDINKYKFNLMSRAQIREEFGIPERAFVIGTVGRMSEEKNHAFLVHILPKLCERIDNIHLLIVGDGDEYEQCVNIAERLKISSKVTFAGARSDIPNVLSAIDLFLLPSLNEGLGIVAIEAAASGLPVILSDAVPDTLQFLPNSHFVPLIQEKWIEQILKMTCISVERLTNYDVLKEHNYDITSAAKLLEAIYSKDVRTV